MSGRREAGLAPEVGTVACLGRLPHAVAAERPMPGIGVGPAVCKGQDIRGSQHVGPGVRSLAGVLAVVSARALAAAGHGHEAAEHRPKRKREQRPGPSSSVSRARASKPSNNWTRKLAHESVHFALARAARDGHSYGSSIRTGTLLLVVDPSPSWPCSLNPQHQALPSASTAQVCPHPALITVTPVRPCTGTGR